MLCPLRKMIKSADFDECYKERCEWWITKFFPHCAITNIALSIEKFTSQSRHYSSYPEYDVDSNKPEGR